MTLLLCFFLFQKHENEEDGSSGNKDGERKEKKESNVAISFVFGQNIKDRAKVSFPSAGCEQVNSKQEFLCQAIVCVCLVKLDLKNKVFYSMCSTILFST